MVQAGGTSDHVTVMTRLEWAASPNRLSCGGVTTDLSGSIWAGGMEGDVGLTRESFQTSSCLQPGPWKLPIPRSQPLDTEGVISADRSALRAAQGRREAVALTLSQLWAWCFRKWLKNFRRLWIQRGHLGQRMRTDQVGNKWLLKPAFIDSLQFWCNFWPKLWWTGILPRVSSCLLP